MKKLFLLPLLLISNLSFANGVILTCWEMGLPQIEDYILYQNDGSDSSENYILFGDMVYDLVQFDATIGCANNLEKRYCQDIFFHPEVGNVEIHLKQQATYNNGTQGMVGKIKEFSERDIYCERKSL